MLPDDTKARRAAALDTLLQTQVDGHFKTATPEDLKKPEPYSDKLFRDAAIQWLVETDQVSYSFILFSNDFCFLMCSQFHSQSEHSKTKHSRT